MTLEDWQHQRVATIAMMAATIEAGDRARSDVPHGDPRIDTPKLYAHRALALFEAVDAIEAV